MVFVFGRTPLFYFLFHFLLLHLLTFPLGLFRYGKVDFLWVPAPSMAGIPWRLRLRTANRICQLGLHRDRYVSTLPVVREPESVIQFRLA